MKTQYWVIGGQFTSLNFHSFLQDTTIVRGPFKSREDAQEEWKTLSEQYRYKASYRFLITEEKIKTYDNVTNNVTKEVC